MELLKEKRDIAVYGIQTFDVGKKLQWKMLDRYPYLNLEFGGGEAYEEVQASLQTY